MPDHAASDDRELILGDADGSRRRVPGRYPATALDLLVGGYVVGSVLASLAALGWIGERLPAGVGLAVLWVVLVVAEGLTGRSPGKHVAGIDVVGSGGRRVALRDAALRRPWGLPLLVLPFGPLPRLLGTITALLVLIAMGLATVRAADGRGLHDRLAGTTVVAGEPSPRARVVTIVVLLTVVIGAAAIRAATATGAVA